MSWHRGTIYSTAADICDTCDTWGGGTTADKRLRVSDSGDVTCSKPTAVGFGVACVCACVWGLDRSHTQLCQIIVCSVHEEKEIYSEHFQAIIGLIPVLEEASLTLTPHPAPLFSPLCCSLTFHSLHFLHSLQPCFFSFIPTKFFPHPSHSSYLSLPSPILAPSGTVSLFSAQCVPHVCSWCWLHSSCS